MIQKRSFSLSNEVKWHLHEMVKIHVKMLYNMGIFIICMGMGLFTLKHKKKLNDNLTKQS